MRSGPKYGASQYSAYDTVGLSQLTNVPVFPSACKVAGRHKGGPILVAAEEHAFPHLGLTAESDPAAPDVPPGLPKVEESFVWGGFAEQFVGPVIEDIVTRLIHGRAERPEDRVLFAMPPATPASKVGPRFWQAMEWVGLAPEQVALVDSPFRAREVWVAPDAELNGILAPSYAQLERLANNTTARNLAPNAADALYVSRAYFMDLGLGTWFGETYIEAKLEDLGVPVLRPDTATIRMQLSRYAGAKSLIFAEGEALLGRHLLGFYDQDIHVLNREPGARSYLPSLMPRCRNLHYAEVTKDRVGMVSKTGDVDEARAISIYKEDALLHAFDVAGVPLRDVWDTEAYQVQSEEAMQSWLLAQVEAATKSNRPIDPEASMERIGNTLRQHGFAHVLDRAKDALNAKTQDAT